MVVSGNMCKNIFKAQVLLLFLNKAIKHMTKNVKHMPFSSQVPFLLSPDLNMETYREYLDRTSVDANTLAEKLSHFIIVSDLTIMLKIMAMNSYITKVLSSTSDVPLTDLSQIIKGK